MRKERRNSNMDQRRTGFNGFKGDFSFTKLKPLGFYNCFLVFSLLSSLMLISCILYHTLGLNSFMFLVLLVLLLLGPGQAHGDQGSVLWF